MGDQTEKNETGWSSSMYGERRGVYRVLWKPKRKSLGRYRHRWKYHIKIDLQEVGC